MNILRSRKFSIIWWAAILLAAAFALAIAVWPSGHAASASARASRIAHELRCEECQGLSVADSNATTSQAMRKDIRSRIAAGQSDTEIKQAYVDTYGENILLSPPGHGVGLFVWFLPIVVLIAAGCGVLIAILRSRRPLAIANLADEEIVATEREHL